MGGGCVKFNLYLFVMTRWNTNRKTYLPTYLPILTNWLVKISIFSGGILLTIGSTCSRSLLKKLVLDDFLICLALTFKSVRQKLGIILENKVFENLKLSKHTNNKKKRFPKRWPIYQPSFISTIRLDSMKIKKYIQKQIELTIFTWYLSKTLEYLIFVLKIQHSSISIFSACNFT